MILAGIDIGTNAIRLLIADVRSGSFRAICSDRVITRLGQNLERDGILSADAQERSIAVLGTFARDIAEHRCEAVSVVGTSALRRAGNTGAFVDAVMGRTGLELRVISGEEEARLMLLGVRTALAPSAKKGMDPLASALVIDIGGGSTEMIVTAAGAARDVRSLDLGAVYLTERYLHHDPPRSNELASLRAAVDGRLREWEQELRQKHDILPADLAVLAGTAGTITTLAAMDLQLGRYDAARINGHVLSQTALDEITSQLCRLTLAERRTLPGLETGREDIILAGVVVCQEIMFRSGKGELIVSDWGLREGIVFERYDELCRK